MFGIGRDNTADAKIRVGYDGKEAENGLRSLTKTIKTVITAAVIKITYDYAKSLAELGAQSSLVEKNFSQFANSAGQNTDVMMKKLRTATKGMVSDMALQQQAMKAMISGIDFNDMIVAMEYVTNYAIATGSNVSEKMNTVMTGLARKSAMFMDDVGIQVMGAKDVVRATIDQMKEKMDQFATSEEDAAVKAGQLASQWENLKAKAGQELIPAFNTLTSAAIEVVGWLDKMLETWGKLWAMAGGVVGGQNRFFAETVAVIEGGDPKKMETRRKGLESIISLTEKNIKVYENAGKLSKKAQENYQKELKEIQLLRTQYEMLGNAISNNIRNAKQKQVKVGSAGGAVDKGGGEAKKTVDELIIEMLKAEELQKGIGVFGQENEQDKIRNAILGDIDLLKELNDVEVAIQESRTKTGELNAQIRMENERKEYEQRLLNAQEFLNSVATINNAFMAVSDAVRDREIRNIDQTKMSRKQYEKEMQRVSRESERRARVFARIQQGIAIGEAIVNASVAATGAGRDTKGPAWVRIAATLSTLATGMAQVAAIQAQHFQGGGLVGDLSNVRRPDDQPAMLGRGEYIMPAPQTAQNIELLEAIRNNTAGLRRGGGGGTVNIYGVSSNQIQGILRDQERRNYSGVAI